MRKFLLLVFILILSYSIVPNDLATLDRLLDEGKYSEALPVVEKLFDKTKPEAKVLWKLGRVYYELADASKSKKETISICEKGMAIMKPFIDGNIGGEPIDKAKVVYWYDVLYSRRGKAIGIKESLDIIPELFSLADKAISIYKEIGEPYHLKAMIDDAVPSFLGGDKFRMGVNFNYALKYDPENLTFIVDAANGFYERNWDSKKREAEAKKNNMKDDGTPSGLSDRAYAKQLIDKAIKIAESKKSLTFSEKKKYNEALELSKKIK